MTKTLLWMRFSLAMLLVLGLGGFLAAELVLGEKVSTNANTELGMVLVALIGELKVSFATIFNTPVSDDPNPPPAGPPAKP